MFFTHRFTGPKKLKTDVSLQKSKLDTYIVSQACESRGHSQSWWENIKCWSKKLDSFNSIVCNLTKTAMCGSHLIADPSIMIFCFLLFLLCCQGTFATTVRIKICGVIFTKQGTSHFAIYVNIPNFTYIWSRSTVLYPLRTVVRK